MIVVCSLKDLETVCSSVKPSHVISVIDPGFAIMDGLLPGDIVVEIDNIPLNKKSLGEIMSDKMTRKKNYIFKIKRNNPETKTAQDAKTLNKIIIPICLIGIFVTQLIVYLQNDQVNFFLIATACFVSPAAIKGYNSKYQMSSFIYYLLLIIGLVLMVMGFYINL